MKHGRYIARREYIRSDLQEHAGLVLEVYDWLVRHSPDAAQEARGCGVSGVGFLYQRGGHASQSGRRHTGADPGPGPVLPLSI